MEAPPWLETGDRDRPFHFSQAMHRLCADIALRCPLFHSFDLNRILFGFSQARKGQTHGLQARVTPMRFANGESVRWIRGKSYRVQQYQYEGREILYLVTFCLPRFLDRSFEDKLITIFHELYHIDPRFNGDLRRHQGRYAFHTASQKEYDRGMAELAREYLSIGAAPQLYDFLRLTFEQLHSRHGLIVANRFPRPKLIPVGEKPS